MQTDSSSPAPFDTATFIFPAEWHALSDIFGGAGTGVLFLREGVIAHVNRNLCEQLGYTESELIGRPVEMLFPPGTGLPHAEGAARRHDDDPTEGTRITLCDKGGLSQEFDLVINRVDTLHNAAGMIWVLQASGARLVREAAGTTADAARAQAIVEHLPELLLFLEPDSTLSHAGASIGEILGYDVDDLLGRRFSDLVHSDDLPALDTGLRRALDTEPAAHPVLFRVRHRNGGWRHIAAQLRSLQSNPTASGILLSGRDVTAEQQDSQRRNAAHKRQLHYLNRLFRMAQKPQTNLNSALKVILKAATKALDAHRCAYWEIGDTPAGNRCVMAYDEEKQNFVADAPGDPASADVLHALLQQTRLNTHPLTFADVDLDPRAALFCEYFHAAGIKAAIMVPVQRAGQNTGMLILAQLAEARAWRKDESEFAANVAGLVSLIFVQVDRNRAEAQLRHIAHHDDLTGLPNRHFLFDQGDDILPKVTMTSPSLAAFFIDLDGFKQVNDNYGHATGDDLLRAAAMRLRNVVRKDDILVRLGGDEFMLLARNLTDLHVAEDIATQIVDAMHGRFCLQGRELQISASVGIALYPHDGHDIETLMKKADIAMYNAKAGGRDQYRLFTPMLDELMQGRQTLEEELQRAIEEHELQHYYQPQIDLRTGQVRSVEALLRWHHPRHGMLLPAHFLPLAEQSGLIHRISEWVLNDACEQLRIWRTQGLGRLGIAINLSASQLMDQSLLPILEAALDRSGVTGEEIELEIKESTAMQHNTMTASLLDRITDMHIGLSIDDFGTGYSNMAYLRRYPVHKVKIDRSFVSGLPGETDDRAITDAIISMAQPLGLDVVAEGVETEQQVDYLRNNGCDIAQGFFFTQPLTADQFEKWLIRH
jgi:diguanylate cyclase (GGDEF)-like protein/PAS domain S-box-containing protein